MASTATTRRIAQVKPAAAERRLEEISAEEFERELEEACKANAQMNLEILKEFEHVDRKAWAALP